MRESLHFHICGVVALMAAIAPGRRWSCHIKKDEAGKNRKAVKVSTHQIGLACVSGSKYNTWVMNTPCHFVTLSLCSRQSSNVQTRRGYTTPSSGRGWLSEIYQHSDENARRHLSQAKMPERVRGRDLGLEHHPRRAESGVA